MGMIDTGTGGAPPGDLPAGLRQRQTWRSPMRRTLDALLLGVEGRTGSMMDVVAGHIAWHEALSRRAEPWSGWTPLILARSTVVPAVVSGPERLAGTGKPPVAERGPAGPPTEAAGSAPARRTATSASVDRMAAPAPAHPAAGSGPADGAGGILPDDVGARWNRAGTDRASPRPSAGPVRRPVPALRRTTV